MPLNAYAESKHEFDKWVLRQNDHPPFWVGLKFFNVYGPNEFHKDRMASVIFHTVNQIKEFGSVKLFRSHNKDYKDGEQSRDFVYVKDVVDILYFMMSNQNKNGIFNIGTGRARTFLELVSIIFRSMKIQPVFSFIDTPEEIRERYQYFTEAKIDKLRAFRYRKPFTELEDGVEMYIQDYLLKKNYF